MTSIATNIYSQNATSEAINHRRKNVWKNKQEGWLSPTERPNMRQYLHILASPGYAPTGTLNERG